jgi:hypothetical protein
MVISWEFHGNFMGIPMIHGNRGWMEEDEWIFMDFRWLPGWRMI